MNYTEILGWIATGVISYSFFTKSLKQLKYMQLFSAVLWAVYGLLIHSNPVILANILVVIAICLSWKK